MYVLSLILREGTNLGRILPRMTFHTPKFGFCSAFGGGSGGMPGLLGPNLGSIFLGEGTAGHKWLKTSIASTLMQHFQGGYLYGNDAFSYEPLDYLNGTPLMYNTFPIMIGLSHGLSF